MSNLSHGPAGGDVPGGIASKRVAAYVRTRTVFGAQRGIARQEAAISPYVADRPQWKLERLYADIGSSAAFHRLGLQRMLQAAAADQFDVLVVHRIDRLARRIDDLATIMSVLREASVELHTATEPFDTSAKYPALLVDIIGVYGDVSLDDEDENGIAGRLQRHRHAQRRRRPYG